MLLGIGVGVDNLGVLHDGTILDALVDFHQVLINHAAATNVQVTHLAVTHLAIGQTHILATRLERAVGIGCAQEVKIGSGSTVNSVALTVGALTPAVQYHQ